MQEPDEDDLEDDEDAAPADVAAAARAAGIDVRKEGAAAEDGAADARDGEAAMLNVQEMRRDAFWLQRRISRAMPEKEADAAQQLSESVFAALQASLSRWPVLGAGIHCNSAYPPSACAVSIQLRMLSPRLCPSYLCTGQHHHPQRDASRGLCFGAVQPVCLWLIAATSLVIQSEHRTAAAAAVPTIRPDVQCLADKGPGPDQYALSRTIHPLVPRMQLCSGFE